MTSPAAPRRVRYLIAGALALQAACAVAPLAAQGRPLRAFGRQDLNFGALLPGVPTTINRLDAANAGQFELRGQRDTEVRVDFTLPAALTDINGRTVSLQFGPGDGGFSQTSAIGSATAFDPRVPLLATLSDNGRLYLFLGGTALPAPTQQRGDYTATITVSVAYTGV